MTIIHYPEPNQHQLIPSYHQMDSLETISDDLEFVKHQLFQAKDRLNQDSLLWGFFGRWSYRRDLSKRINALYTQIEATRQDAILRYHEQQAAYLLKRQQQQYDYEFQYVEFQFQQRLLDETLQRQFQRLALVIDMISPWFEPGGRFDGLDPEIQQETAMGFIQSAMGLALRPTENENDSANNLDYIEEDYS